MKLWIRDEGFLKIKIYVVYKIGSLSNPLVVFGYLVCTFSWKENKYYSIPKSIIQGFMCNNNYFIEETLLGIGGCL